MINRFKLKKKTCQKLKHRILIYDEMNTLHLTLLKQFIKNALLLLKNLVWSTIKLIRILQEYIIKDKIFLLVSHRVDLMDAH